MNISWIGYWLNSDGYGRFNTRMVRALQSLDVAARAIHIGELDRPSWMLHQMAIDWNDLTISCCPPYMVKKLPGRHWLFSMVEGSVLPNGWAKTINTSGVERVLVPCQHNADVFIKGGVIAPVSVVPGGTDPEEFPMRRWTSPYGTRSRLDGKPFTFLTIADRGFRKGWDEVREAFYVAFGGKTDGVKDVRLIIKSRPKDKVSLISLMDGAIGKDSRVTYRTDDPEDMFNVYGEADVLVLPSRCEGWGMPHREAACMGIPVITQQSSGMDDGHLYAWALVVEGGTMQPIPIENTLSLGEWMIADIGELAEMMERCYNNPEMAWNWGVRGAKWIKQNQTWGHSALRLISLMKEESYGSHLECRTLPLVNGFKTKLHQSLVPDR